MKQITLREEALKEFETLTQATVPELESRFTYEERQDLSALTGDIWQGIDKTTNLCMLLWKLNLQEEAEKLEDLKIQLSRMHRELIQEMKSE